MEEWTLAISIAAAALTVISNLMKRMVPLRVFAMLGNAVFVVAEYFAHDRVAVALQFSLMLINGYRLWDLKRLIRAMAHANEHAPLSDWLLPHMRKKKYAAGTQLFAKGDEAHEMFYVHSGTVRLVENGHRLGAGSLIGEIGLFAEDRKRTASIVCETACVCYTMTDEAIYLLYFQNPRLGFLLVRMIVQRLTRDLAGRPDVAQA